LSSHKEKLAPEAMVLALVVDSVVIVEVVVVEVVEEADQEDRVLQILDAKATGGMTQILFLCNMT